MGGGGGHIPQPNYACTNLLTRILGREGGISIYSVGPATSAILTKKSIRLLGSHI